MKAQTQSLSVNLDMAGEAPEDGTDGLQFWKTIDQDSDKHSPWTLTVGMQTEFRETVRSCHL